MDNKGKCGRWNERGKGKEEEAVVLVLSKVWGRESRLLHNGQNE